jgi:hypothetical protein
MGKVVAQAIMSLDGYVAKQDNTIGRLFDWLQNGEVEISAPAGGLRRPPDPAEFGTLAVAQAPPDHAHRLRAQRNRRTLALLRRMRRRQPRAFRSVPDEVALRRLGVTVPEDPEPERLVPSLAGLLTLGSYPQEFFPQLNVTFVVFPSDQAGVVPEGGPRFIDNRSLNGPVPWVVSDAVDAITRNMRIAGTIRGVGRQDVYEYPVEALREAIVNAITCTGTTCPARHGRTTDSDRPTRQPQPRIPPAT